MFGPVTARNWGLFSSGTKPGGRPRFRTLLVATALCRQNQQKNHENREKSGETPYSQLSPFFFFDNFCLLAVTQKSAVGLTRESGVLNWHEIREE